MKTLVFLACIVALLPLQSGFSQPAQPQAASIAWERLVDDRCNKIDPRSLQSLSVAAMAAFEQSHKVGEPFGVCAWTGYNSATVQFVPAGGDVRPMHEVRCAARGGELSWTCRYFKAVRILIIGNRGVSFAEDLDERLVRNAAEFLTKDTSSALIAVPGCGHEPGVAPVLRLKGADIARLLSRIYVDFDGALTAELPNEHLRFEQLQVAGDKETFRIVCWFRIAV